MLTRDIDSFTVVIVKPSESFWEAWERIRASSDPDPLEVLRIASAFSRYFESAQKEAISFARSSGLPWEQIAAALGQSRQAIWQRARRDPELREQLHANMKRRWLAIRSDPTSWYVNENVPLLTSIRVRAWRLWLKPDAVAVTLDWN